VNGAVTSRQGRWHQSTLSTLLDGCSWQYFLTYVAGIDTGVKPLAAVGTAYHAAVELSELARKQGLPRSEAQMLEHAEEELRLVTQEPDHIEKVRACVKNYWAHIRPYLEQYEPVALEPEFTIGLVEGARPIGGFIDGIYRDPADGKLFVIDHKSVGNFSRWRNTDSHRHQAAMYAVALVMSEEFPEITELPEMRYLLVRTSLGSRANFEPSRILALQPDLEDVRVLGDRIRQAEAVVSAAAYTKNTSWPLCSPVWCPYYSRCVLGDELSGTVESVLSVSIGSREAQYISSTTTTTTGDTNV
jgi:hypothetical protein